MHDFAKIEHLKNDYLKNKTYVSKYSLHFVSVKCWTKTNIEEKTRHKLFIFIHMIDHSSKLNDFCVVEAMVRARAERNLLAIHSKNETAM